MKKLFTLFFALVASVGTIFAEIVNIGDLYYDLNHESKTAEVAGIGDGKGYPNLKTARIPESVSYDSVKYSVTSIKEYAFYGCTGLTSVTIPNGVTSIGGSAFGWCDSLTSVNIPNSVTSIGQYTFSGCTSLPIIDNIRYADTYLIEAVDKALSSYTIKDGTRWIGDDAFRDCERLNSINIPNSITTIRAGAFSWCSSLTAIEFPNSVTSIWTMAFYGCTGLTSVTIPNCVTNVGNSAFGSCKNLEKVTINSDAIMSTTSGNDYNFSTIFGKQVKEYIIGDKVTTIGYFAFYDCTYMTSIIIPNSVTSIGESAFSMCTSLTSVTIPNGVTSIGEQAFSYCRSLISIEIPNSVTYIGRSAFRNCRSLKSVRIPDGVTCIYESTFSYSGIASITIPEQIVKIESWPFSECDSLSSVVWNAKKCNVGSNLFDYSKVQALVVGEEVESLPQAVLYSTNDGYDSDSLKSVVWNAIDCCIDNTSYTGPNCDGSLPAKGLEKITFGNKVERIPGEICRHSKIKSLVIPNSVKKIGLLAFGSSDSLTTVILGSGVTELESYEGFGGYSVFPGCNNLTFITCYATTPPKITESFNYKRTKVYVPAANVDAYKSTKYWKDCTILPISASDTEISTVTTTATENSVDITWPSVSGAATYELVIKDKEGKVICTLIFNNNGQLTSIVFKAPSRDDAPQKTQATGFSFTITGLEPGTEYDLIITAKNESGQEIDKKNISFHTNWPNGIEDIHVNSDKPVKVLHDGQIYILRGEHIYDSQGKMVR